MSNFSRSFARRGEEQRPRRPIMHHNGTKGWKHYTLVGEPQYYSGQHSTGDKWWQETLADLVERRQDDGTYAAKPKASKPPERSPSRPEMATRPQGMTRQVQRAIFRRLCKDVGVPWKKTDR